MIKVTLSQLIFIGMILGIVTVGFLWLHAVLRDRRTHKRARSNVRLCRICGCAYQPPSNEDVTVCPVCDTPNERHQMDAI